MANLDYLEHSIPVAPLKICALKGCEALAGTIDQYLVQFPQGSAAAQSGQGGYLRIFPEIVSHRQ